MTFVSIKGTLKWFYHQNLTCAATIPSFNRRKSVWLQALVDHGVISRRSSPKRNSLSWFLRNFRMFHGRSLWLLGRNIKLPLHNQIQTISKPYPSIKGTSLSTFRTISIRSSSWMARHVEIRCTSSVQKKRPHRRKPSVGFRRRMAPTRCHPPRLPVVVRLPDGGGEPGDGWGGGSLRVIRVRQHLQGTRFDLCPQQRGDGGDTLRSLRKRAPRYDDTFRPDGTNQTLTVGPTTVEIMLMMVMMQMGCRF